MKRLLTGIQMYSVRDIAESDLRKTLRQLAAIGYDGVEFAGLYGHTPEAVRDILRELNLVPISAHVGFGELIASAEETVSKYVTVGCSYIAIPSLPQELHPSGGRFDEAVVAIEGIARECKKQGITLLYHNHDFEFQTMPDGRYGLDYLYDSISPELLQTQIDTCWVKVSGLNPAEYVRKYAGRCPLVHLKDYVGGKTANMYELIGDDSAKAEVTKKFEFRAVGSGCQDFAAICRAAAESSAKWQIVEQDSHSRNSSLEDAKISIEYLKSLYMEVL